MDELAAKLDEPVIIQYGSSSYVPRYAECFQWASSQRMKQLIHQARLVVSHAAAGSILTALLEKKPLLVVPRRHKYGEHVDDHQFQLAKAIAKAGMAIAVFEPSLTAMQDAVEKASSLSLSVNGPEQLIEELSKQLAEWTKPTQILERNSQ